MGVTSTGVKVKGLVDFYHENEFDMGASDQIIQ